MRPAKVSPAQLASGRTMLARGEGPEQVTAYLLRAGASAKRAERVAEKLHREFQEGLRDDRGGAAVAIAAHSDQWATIGAFCALLTCMPAGLLAMHLASDAKRCAGRGEVEGAAAKLRSAKIVSLLGIVGGALAIVGYFATRR